MGSQPVDIDRLRVTHGIYGAECTLGMQGFCSFDYRCFPIFLENVDRRINLMPIAMHPMITKPTEDELIHLRGDFYMTTPERSIIDKYEVRDVLEREIEYAHSDMFEM